MKLHLSTVFCCCNCFIVQSYMSIGLSKHELHIKSLFWWQYFKKTAGRGVRCKYKWAYFVADCLRTMIWQQHLAPTDPVWKSWKDFGQILVKISGDRENRLFAMDDNGKFDHLVTTVQATAGAVERSFGEFGQRFRPSCSYNYSLPDILLHKNATTNWFNDFKLEKKGTQQLG